MKRPFLSRFESLQRNSIFRENSFSSIPGVITTQGNGVQDIRVSNSFFSDNDYVSNNEFVSVVHERRRRYCCNGLSLTFGKIGDFGWGVHDKERGERNNDS